MIARYDPCINVEFSNIGDYVRYEDHSDIVYKLSRYIVKQEPFPDMACAQCCPASDVLKYNYLCAYHEAKKFLAKEGGGT